ncbi:hypothetical protein KY334_02015, partial [Candidatus Woesearchaeota archaeon]|nr:hypothetical protein [Candidatus Woesearchaeota archaeon]
TYNNETNTSIVSVIVKAEEDLIDFEYYQRIPKCMALLASLIKFKNENYTVVEDDPLVVWHFAEVKKGTELDFSFEILGEVSPDCYNLMKDIFYEEKFSPINWTGVISGLLVLSTISFIVVKSANQSHKLHKIKVKSKVKSIRNKIKKL